MVHGYHVVLAHYGFWLPEDPRGSWSDFVTSWEIARFGETTRCPERRKMAMLSAEELAQREAAIKSLMYPPVILNGEQALSVAMGFKEQSAKSNYSVWACSILPAHTHLVIARHRYKAEQIVNLLKGAATARLVSDGVHPLRQYAEPNKRPPGMWARHQWISFLDSDDAIENAINYVVENPMKEGKPKQNWKWVTPYAGLDPGWTTYL